MHIRQPAPRGQQYFPGCACRCLRILRGGFAEDPQATSARHFRGSAHNFRAIGIWKCAESKNSPPHATHQNRTCHRSHLTAHWKIEEDRDAFSERTFALYSLPKQRPLLSTSFQHNTRTHNTSLTTLSRHATSDHILPSSSTSIPAVPNLIEVTVHDNSCPKESSISVCIEVTGQLGCLHMSPCPAWPN